MKRYPKFKLSLLAIMVTIFTTIAFSVHCEDTPFRPFARSFVRQGVSSSNHNFNVKTDLPTYFLGNASTILSASIVQCRWKSENLIQLPTLIFTESIPPYRGPPTTIL
jgi:hypothetical protein